MSFKGRLDKVLGKYRESDRFPPNFDHQNVKIIQTLADFPTPVGRFIYLEDKTYLIDAIKLDITGYTLVFGRRTAINGYNQNVSSFQSFEAGATLIKGGANIFMNEIEFYCSANNQLLFECISDGSVPDGTSFEINLFAAYCLDANDNFTTGCQAGFIKDIRQGFIGTQFYFGFAKGFELAGYWTDGGFRVQNTLFRSFDLQNLGGKAFFSSPLDPVTFEARFASNANLNINGNSIGYDFPQSSFTYDGQYQLEAGNVSGTGTFVTDWSGRSPAFYSEANFKDNTGIQNSFPGGEFITNADNVTTFTAINIWTPAIFTTTNKDLTWTLESNGIFTYDSDNILDAFLIYTITLVGQANNIIQVKLVKEDIAMVQTDLITRNITIAGTLAQGRAESVPISTTARFVKGDKVIVYYRNLSGSNDVTTLSNSNGIISAK